MNQKLSLQKITQQKIDQIKSQPVITPHGQELLKHYERLLKAISLTPEQQTEIGEQEEELTEDGSLLANTFNQLSNEKGNIYFQKTVEEENLIDWEEHVKTLDKDLSQLQIEPNKYRFKNYLLIITKKQFPNLITLYACGLDLKWIDLDCPILENLYLVNNNLTDINFNNTPNIKNLVLSKNLICKLRIKHLKKLESLRCNKNRLLNLDVRGLTKLEYLDFAGNFANNIKLGNNPKLDRLDLAENDIGKLNFPPLPSLTELSLRENLYSFGLRKGWEQPTETVIIRSPKLKFLDYNGYSNIKDFEIHKDYPLENPNQLMVCHDKTYQNEDASTEWEQRAYEDQQQREREEFEAGNHVFEGQVCLDLSNRNYIGSITIDGNVNYPQSLESINLGGNYLSEVIIRNLPNLRQLIISYNNVKNLVIENCQQLDHIYDYKSSDLTRITQDGKKYDEKTDNPFKNQEGFIHVEDELRAEANKKKQQFLKDLLILILDIEKDTNEGKWEDVQEKIAKIKEYIKKYSTNEEINQRINRLEQRLLANQTIPAQSSGTQKALGFLVINLTLGLIFLLTNKTKTSKRNKNRNKPSKPKLTKIDPNEENVDSEAEQAQLDLAEQIKRANNKHKHNYHDSNEHDEQENSCY